MVIPINTYFRKVSGIRCRVSGKGKGVEGRIRAYKGVEGVIGILQRLPFTGYRLPDTVYRLPDTVYRLPFTVIKIIGLL